MDADVAEVIRRELLLHQPEVRNDPPRLLAVLHPEFREYAVLVDGAWLMVFHQGTPVPASAAP